MRPLGSAEQHAYLSLATDRILAEKVAGQRLRWGRWRSETRERIESGWE